jgi:hypothetical protein
VKGETAEILNTIFERGTKVDPTLVDLWKDTANQRDELAKLLAEKRSDPPPSPAPQPDVLHILTQVKALQADPLAMLEKLKGFFPAKEHDRPSKEEPSQRNSLDEMKKMLDVVAQAKDLFKSEAPAAAVGPGADAELWERIAVNMSGQAAPVLNALAGIILAFKSKPPVAQPVPGPGAAPMTAPVSVFDPYKDAAAMRNFARSQGTAGSTAAAPSAPSADVASTALGEASAAANATAQSVNEGMVAEVVSLINTALSCLNRGVDGHQCAESIIALNGDLTYDTICKQITSTGVPVVMELARGIPQISAQVASYQEPLQQFIEQFVEGPWDDETEESEGGRPDDTAA